MRILALIAICCVTGCRLDVPGPGHLDFAAKLAGDYSLYRSSSDSVKITPEGWSSDSPIVPSKVIECAVDGKYILAKRQGMKRRSPNNPNDTFDEPDPNIFDYWILDTEAPCVFGHLDIEQFQRKKHELGISDSTELKDVYTFRP